MAEFENTKTRNRYSYAVVSVGFVVLLSIWLLNTTLIEEKRQLEKRETWAYQVNSMIQRLENLERRDRWVTSEAIKTQFLVRASRTEAAVWRDQENFASDIAREISLLTAKTGTLNTRDIESVLNMDERSARLMDEDTKHRIKQILLWLWSKSVWPHQLSVQWVVMGTFPSGEGDGGGGSGSASIRSYIGRMEWRHTEVPRREIISRRLLLTERFPTAKEILLSELQSAWERAELRSDDVTKTDVAPYGMRLGLNEVPVVGAQALVLLQVIFFILWNKDKSEVGNAKHGSRYFDFPAFGSPPDPLDGPPINSLAQVLERTIWALYLILPVCVVAVGILTRYDFTFSPGEKFWPSLILAPRGCDVSLGIDYLHIGALALALGVTWGLTAPRNDLNKINRRRAPKRILTIGTIALVLVAGIGYRWLSVSGFFRQPRFPDASSAWYYGECIWSPGGSLLFATIWAGTLICSIYYRRRFMAGISLLGLALFAFA